MAVEGALAALDAPPPGLIAEYATCLWVTVCQAFQAGRMELAAAWLKNPTLQSPGAVTCRRVQPLPSVARALCLLLAGHRKEAAEHLQKAVTDPLKIPEPAALVVLLLIGAGASQSIEGLQERAAASLSRLATTALIQILLCRRVPPTCGGALTVLTLLARVEALRLQASVEGPPGEEVKVVKALWLLAYALMGSPDHASGQAPAFPKSQGMVRQVLGALQPLVTIHTAAGPASHAAARLLFEGLWNVGISFGRSGYWSLCSEVFKAAIHASSSAFSPDKLLPAAGRTTRRDFKAQEEAEMCYVASMASQLEAAREASKATGYQSIAAQNLFRSVLDAAPRAITASDALLQLRQETVVSASTAHHMLYLMQSEARVMCGDQSLADFLTGIASRELLPARSFLMLARLCLQLDRPALAQQCLRQYLRPAADAIKAGTAVDLEAFASALRELIQLHKVGEDSYGCYSEALTVLRKVGRGFPSRELQWLVATAWNTGEAASRVGTPGAHRWISMAVALVEFCPELEAQKTMFVQALERIGEAKKLGGG